MGADEAEPEIEPRAACDSGEPSSESELPVTPLPMRTLVPLIIVLMNEGICASMLLPFVGLLVAHLEDESENKAGYLSGFLISAFQLGQVISGWFWGRFSDVYGRRVALMSGLLCSGIVMLMFGFSSDVYWCIGLRFVHGLFNGNVLVAKTVIADITDKTNEARGFSMISLSWGVASLVGPAVGGLLFDAGGAFDEIGLAGLGSLFHQYPQLLPAVIVACYSFLALGVAYFYVVETNRHARPIQDLLVYGLSRPRNGGPIVAAAADDDGDGDEGLAEQSKSDKSGMSGFGYVDAFSNPVTRVCIALYVMICASDIMYWETVPLWAIATRDTGGLAMPSSVLGMIIVLNGFPCIFANLVFAHVDRLFLQKMNLWRTSMLIWGTCVVCLPFVSYVDHPFVLIMTNCCIRQFGSSWAFSLVFIIIARTAPAGHMGSMNGIAQSCGCAIRTLVPLFAAPLFAWSISAPHPYPLNHHLVFFLSVCVLAASALVSRSLSNNDLHSTAPVSSLQAYERVTNSEACREPADHCLYGDAMRSGDGEEGREMCKTSLSDEDNDETFENESAV